MTEHYDDLEIRSPKQRETDFVSSIRDQLIHAKANTPAYAEMFKEIDCEDFSSLAELENIPITRKSELMERQKTNPPLGGLVAMEQKNIKYINVSPGPIYEASGPGPDSWRLGRALFAAGFREGEMAINCFSYHLTPAGFMLDGGLHALGCTVIPGGVGQTEMQVQTINDLKPTGYVGTPSFLKIVLEKAEELNLDMRSLQKALVSGEALPSLLRSGFKEKGINVLQAYATADLGVIAYETIADDGLIID